MGGKIAIIIILIAMVGLAGMVTDIPEQSQPALPPTYEETQQDIDETKLTFGNFPTSDPVFDGTPAAVDYSTNPLAASYESIISRLVSSVGVNYASHYSVVTWSCGTSCQASAIIDARTGAVVEYGIISAYGLSFSIDSTLFIINPPELIPQEAPEDTETDYYTISDGQLEFIGKEVRSTGVVDNCIQVIANARNNITNEVIQFNTPCEIPFGWEIVQ